MALLVRKKRQKQREQQQNEKYIWMLFIKSKLKQDR